jgi:hypothetical protein
MKNSFGRLSVLVLGFLALILLLGPIQWKQGDFPGLSVLEAKVLEKSLDSQAYVELDAEDPQVKAVMAVQDSHTDTLLAQPGIIGTATGVDGEGKLSILVLAESYESAKAATVPAQIEGVAVVVKITGVIVPLSRLSLGNVDHTKRWPRPVPIGVSTGHPDITAGTIGCRVTDGRNFYALSNNHVYADENLASIGDNVLQPGRVDGGVDPADAIGTLFDFEPINFSGRNNTMDAAIALSATNLLGNDTPRGCYRLLQSTPITARLNMLVMKCGRTTKNTVGGRITAINATIDVQYDTGIARFIDQIVITKPGFSQGGDSGSLVVKGGFWDRGAPVGLLFAGSPNTTIANPIRTVLDRFGVTIDGRFR